MINDHLLTYDSNNNRSYDRTLTPKTNYNFNNKFNPSRQKPRTINSRDNSVESNINLRKSNYKTLKNAVSLKKEKRNNNNINNNKTIRSKQSSFDYSLNKTNNQTSVNNYLIRRHQETQQKLMKIKSDNILQELKEIKDRPIISDNSKKIIENKSQSKINVFDRLTSKSHNRKKESELKKLEEMNNKNTLKPKINEYSNQIQRSIDDLLYWKENLMQKREYQINEINSHMVTNPSINKTSEEILREKNPGYLGTKVEDRLIQQGMISKYKIEGKKGKYNENGNQANQSKSKNNQNHNKNDFNLENIFTAASDNLDNANMSPTSMKNLKRNANNTRTQKEINTSIIYNYEDLNSDRLKKNHESISSPKNYTNKAMNIKTLPSKNNPYNFHPYLNSRKINTTKEINNLSYNSNIDPSQFKNNNQTNNKLNNKEKRNFNSINKGDDYERYSSKLIPAERFLNLNTVDQISYDYNYNKNPQNQMYEQARDNIPNLNYNDNDKINQLHDYNQRRNNSNKLHDELNSPIETNNNNFEGNRTKESSRKIIYNNKAEFINNINSSHQEINHLNTLEGNFTQNARITPNFNINTSISSITNNLKNYSTIIPNTTKNQSVSNANNFNLDQNNNSNNNYLNKHNQSGKSNYSSTLNSASRNNNQNNTSHEKINNFPNQKGSVSFKNYNNKSFEKVDANKNNPGILLNTRNISYSNTLLANNKNVLSKPKTNENEYFSKTKKSNVESNLSPSEKIVDIRKHLDYYYKSKQVENKNKYFKEFMTTHNDSDIQNIINDYNTGNNNYKNPRDQIPFINTDSDEILSFNNEDKNNENSEFKRFNYKDFKEKVLLDYQNAKNSNKYSCHNTSSNIANPIQLDNFNQEKDQINTMPLNHSNDKAESNIEIFSELNKIQDDRPNKTNYNFRKDLIYNQNCKTSNNILNIKNNYNASNREFNKINNDLIDFNPDSETIKTSKNINPGLSDINTSYPSRGILKNDRTNNLSDNEKILDQNKITNLSNNFSSIYNFKREKNETQNLNTENSIKPVYETDKLGKESKNEANKAKKYNGSYQNSGRKNYNSNSLNNENNNENLNSRERDVNSIMDYMNNLHMMNSSNDNNLNNNFDINQDKNNNLNNQVNYNGEINNINNQIEYINERLKLNEINKNFVMTKIDSKRINLNN